MDEKEEKQDGNHKNIGEFIPTYFGWVSVDKQKKRAEELDKKTKK